MMSLNTAEVASTVSVATETDVGEPQWLNAPATWEVAPVS